MLKLYKEDFQQNMVKLHKKELQQKMVKLHKEEFQQNMLKLYRKIFTLQCLRHLWFRTSFSTNIYMYERIISFLKFNIILGKV
jgi:hypothetical protein